MLNLTVRNTKKLVREKVKTDNVRIGRLFSKKEEAQFALALAALPEKEEIAVLDCGAGTGILSAAAVEAIAAQGKAKRISLSCYETDAACLSMLKDNLERVRKKCYHDYKIRLFVTVREEDYLLAPRPLREGGFDLVLSNPPRVLLSPADAAFLPYKEECSGETDAAYLFALAGAGDLCEGGTAVFYLPAVFASGVYVSKLRQKILKTAPLVGMHLFLKKEGKADKDALFAFRRADAPAEVTVKTSFTGADTVRSLLRLSYGTAVQRKDGTLLLVYSEEEAKVLQIVRSFPETLSSLGLRMRTGLTLESRHASLIRQKPDGGAVPLVHPVCIHGGQVLFPREGEKNRYLLPTEPSLLQKNKNMLFIKRVPAKSDKKPLVVGAYLAARLPLYSRISTHNKLNYVDFADGREMDFNLLLGLYGVLNTSLYSRYYAVVSKSKQINVSEFAALPLPSVSALRSIGAKLALGRVYNEKTCDTLLIQQMRTGRL